MLNKIESVMHLIQHKVTAPIVNSGISVVMDKLTEEYQKDQQDLLIHGTSSKTNEIFKPEKK